MLQLCLFTVGCRIQDTPQLPRKLLYDRKQPNQILLDLSLRRIFVSLLFRVLSRPFEIRVRVCFNDPIKGEQTSTFLSSGVPWSMLQKIVNFLFDFRPFWFLKIISSQCKILSKKIKQNFKCNCITEKIYRRFDLLYHFYPAP